MPWRSIVASKKKQNQVGVLNQYNIISLCSSSNKNQHYIN
jgi:hypothetical protein